MIQRPPGMKQRFIVKHFLLFFCSFTLPTLILGGLLLASSFSGTSREIQRRVDNSLGLVKENMDLFSSEGHTVNYYLENGRQMTYFHTLLSSRDIGYRSSLALKNMTSLVNSLTDAKVYLDSMYLYFPNEYGRVFTSQDNITTLDTLPDSGWEREFAEHSGGQSWMRRRTMHRREFEDPYQVVSLYKRFQQYRGGVVVNYRLSQLTALMDGIVFQEGQNLFVADERGEVLFGNSALDMDTAARLLALDNPEILSRATLGGRAYLIRVQSYAPAGVRIATFTPVSVIYASVLDELRNTLVLLSLITAVGIGMAYYMASGNFRQLSGIIDIFDRAQSGQRLPPVDTGKDDLFSYILNNVTRTFVERSYLRIQLSQRRYKLKAAELMALQYQINPHFLFNTLQTINYEVLSLTAGKDTQANRMVEELSDILRYSLQPPDAGVSLDTEVRHCQKYLSIQNVRYDGGFSVDWRIESQVLDLPVPRLILQPLLENCIDHGFKGRAVPGRIRVSARLRGDRVCFRMVDNGRGIPRERLCRLRMELADVSEERELTGGHIGLLNCSQRLVLHHGPDSRIHIRSRQGMGTAVWFQVPAEGQNAVSPGRQ